LKLLFTTGTGRSQRYLVKELTEEETDRVVKALQHKAAGKDVESAEAKKALDELGAKLGRDLSPKRVSVPGNADFVGPLTLEQHYARSVHSNRPWSWADDIPGGAKLTAGQKAAIRRNAIAQGLIKDIPYVPGTKFADFNAAGLVERADDLPRELWLAKDPEQFKWLDSRIPGGRPPGTTWHHSHIEGRMELVPFGQHNIFRHQGGRAPGMWADAPR
jgi:hypothetical protein